MSELFCKNNHQLLVVNYFPKKLHDDIWLGREYIYNSKRFETTLREILIQTGFNSFNDAGLFLYSLIVAENLWFSDVLREYGMNTVVWTGIHWAYKISCSLRKLVGPEETQAQLVLSRTDQKITPTLHKKYLIIRYQRWLETVFFKYSSM